MSKIHNGNDSRKIINLAIHNDREIPYLHFLNNHKDELDRKWIEMNGEDVAMEGNIDYITYIVDKYIEWRLMSNT